MGVSVMWPYMLVGPPTCAVCRRQVDLVTTRVEKLELVVVARCHGEVEESRLSLHDLDPATVITMGEAFASPVRRLPHAEGQ